MILGGLLYGMISLFAVEIIGSNVCLKGRIMVKGSDIESAFYFFALF